MAEQEAPAGGIWLRILSSLIITLMFAALIYGAVIGLINYQRIGV